jgi:hypothetical protein
MSEKTEMSAFAAVTEHATKNNTLAIDIIGKAGGKWVRWSGSCPPRIPSAISSASYINPVPAM